MTPAGIFPLPSQRPGGYWLNMAEFWPTVLQAVQGWLEQPSSKVPKAAVPPPAAVGRDAEFIEAATRFLVELEGCPPHPYWPGGTSGVTWGVGWDASEQTVAALHEDWAALPSAARQRLLPTVGKDKKGPVAKALVVGLRDLTIPQPAAMTAFRNRLLPRYVTLTQRAFPGVDRLPVPVRISLVSLVFNRGASMGDAAAGQDRRYEMRQIRQAVAVGDLPAIAREIRAMKRLWVGTDLAAGMTRRRDAEAVLVETGLGREGDWNRRAEDRPLV